jgi:hypothetical protein
MLAVVIWVGGYIDNRFHWSGRPIEGPRWMHLICGLPKVGISDKSLTTEGLFFQVAGLLFLVVAVARRYAAVNDFVVVCISFIVALAVVIIVYLNQGEGPVPKQ